VEKILQLLEFPVPGIVSPVCGLITGAILSYMKVSAKWCCAVLATLALLLFVYCALFEGVSFQSVTVPGYAFGLAAVPVFLIPAIAVRLVFSKWSRRHVWQWTPLNDT